MEFHVRFTADSEDGAMIDRMRHMPTKPPISLHGIPRIPRPIIVSGLISGCLLGAAGLSGWLAFRGGPPASGLQLALHLLFLTCVIGFIVCTVWFITRLFDAGAGRW